MKPQDNPIQTVLTLLAHSAAHLDRACRNRRDPASGKLSSVVSLTSRVSDIREWSRKLAADASVRPVRIALTEQEPESAAWESVEDDVLESYFALQGAVAMLGEFPALFGTRGKQCAFWTQEIMEQLWAKAIHIRTERQALPALLAKEEADRASGAVPDIFRAMSF